MYISHVLPFALTPPKAYEPTKVLFVSKFMSKYCTVFLRKKLAQKYGAELRTQVNVGAKVERSWVRIPPK